MISIKQRVYVFKMRKHLQSERVRSVHLNKCLNTSKEETSFLLRNEKFELNLQQYSGH